MEFDLDDDLRAKYKNVFKKFFPVKYVSDIEEGFYEYSKQFCISDPVKLPMADAVYCSAIKNFIYNCRDDNKTMENLKSKMKKGTFNPYNFAFMTFSELDEENWRKIIQRRETSQDKMDNLPTVEWKPCRECKGTQYIIRELQTRGGDEPTTLFYYCNNCPRTYKVNN